MVLLELTDDAWAAVTTISEATGQAPHDFIDDAIVSAISCGTEGAPPGWDGPQIPRDDARAAALQPTVRVVEGRTP